MKGFITSENHILKYTSKHGRFLPINSLKNGVCVCVRVGYPKNRMVWKKTETIGNCGFLGFKLWPYPNSCLQLEFSRHGFKAQICPWTTSQLMTWWSSDDSRITLCFSNRNHNYTLKTNKQKHQLPPSSENLEESGPSPFDPVGYSSDEASRTSLRLSRKCWDSTTESQ